MVDYSSPVRTRRGEVVKSDGERQIADYMYANNIRYVYERKLESEGLPSEGTWIAPDFFLTDYNVYLEFWGLIDVGDAKERNDYRTKMEWKQRQYQKNNVKFISLFPWNLQDLDGSFKSQFRSATGQALQHRTQFAGLPVAQDLQPFALGSITNAPVLSLSAWRLFYAPYFIVRFSLFTQGYVNYERKNLESQGLLVVDGRAGQIMDMEIERGVVPQLPRTGIYSPCARLEPRPVPPSIIAGNVQFTNIERLLPKVFERQAAETAKTEIARSTSQTYDYLYRNRYPRTTTLRPALRDIKISSSSLVYVPFITITCSYLNRQYSRTIQAATGRIVIDDFSYCNVEAKHYNERNWICMECGSIACKQHARTCDTCGKPLCAKDATSTGLLMKKDYCRDHRPVRTGT